MDFILSLVVRSIGQVWLSLQHNWPFLVMSVLIAALLKVFINAEKVSNYLNRHRGSSVLAATAAAIATPLCSCGTTAVVLGMMATTMPWAPIIAFMVSSPLTSPEGLVYSAGLFGWQFAWAFYLSSIALGLGGGWIASVFEGRGWLANQTRFAKPAPTSCPCSTSSLPAADHSRATGLEMSLIEPVLSSQSCGCSAFIPVAAVADCGCSDNMPLWSQEVRQAPTNTFLGKSIDTQKLKTSLDTFLKELVRGGKTLLIMFLGFAFIGYFLNGLIPTSWVTALFGSGKAYSVPLAASLGLPFYINSEASLPLVRAMLETGMSQGAALAFLIAGAGTSIGAITGALAIARWRVVGLVVGILWAGAIACGFIYDAVLVLM